ncbi:MAG: glycosyltransferase [Hyphomicrobiales bacterium]|nr:MAG: glycosyltransferase [Hyphomicrobiales bacterium]
MTTQIQGSDRIRVLQLITGLGAGGAERLLLDLLRSLDSVRFDVRVATLSSEMGGLAVYGHPDLPVEVFDMSEPGKLRQFVNLRRFVRTFDPHVLHSHMFHALAAGLLVTRSGGDSPAVCFTSHCYHQAFSSARQAMMRWTRSMRAADVIFSADQHPHLNTARTVVIPNGVPVPDEVPGRRQWNPSGPVRLLAVGRLADQKDPLGLIRDFAALSTPSATLDFAGEGPLAAKARALVERLGLAARVRFLGVRSDVRELMRSSDILVMRSKYEGMPMVLLEAGAEAMPVVATPVGAIPSLVAGDRGWLSARETFTASLEQAIQSPEAALHRGRQLHRHVTTFHSIRSTAAAHERLYADLAMKVALADLQTSL